MNRLISIAFILIFISCVNQQREKESGDNDPIVNSTEIHQYEHFNDTISKQTIITDRLLNLVKHIDSSGYSFDTLRSYYRNKKIKTILVDNYVFYHVSYEQSIPYYYSQMIKNDTINFKHNFYKQFNLNSKTFNKVEKIICYFFSKKAPLVENGEKWYVDGMIEEWCFPDNNLAKQASEELGASGNQTVMYFNCGAFVCFVENYMYVMHTRASLFMYSIKPFFKKFIAENKATMTSKETYKFY